MCDPTRSLTKTTMRRGPTRTRLRDLQPRCVSNNRLIKLVISALVSQNALRNSTGLSGRFLPGLRPAMGVAGAICFFWAFATNACTTFCLADTGHVLVGKNYDWDIGDGYVVVNKRNVAKTAVADTNPVSWISRFGSVTFNQFGREMPLGGMNEAGLVVETMWLEDTEYPGIDSRRAIGNLQWIQYHLDCHASVEQVLESDSDIRIRPRAKAPVHYLVCDESGACAGVEFLEGSLVAHTGKDFPLRALTNSTYDQSMRFVRQLRGYGGVLAIPDDRSSLARFARAADRTKEFAAGDRDDNVKYAFDILKDVSAGYYTKWSIVYDVGARAAHFRTCENRKIRTIVFAGLDFSCAKPVKAADINARLSGDITGDLITYTPRRNRDLVESVFARIDFLADLPRGKWRENWEYPQTTECRE
ncbi:MAG: linear amide C-N hydrolase [Chitinivibrionales bacterium]|nr:linear amide C-N hydrolase [Chitinivibrionales bacterium]MBD3395461.1 linear amide C-N hydrolase [Chitinivibrionales bacterium]